MSNTPIFPLVDRILQGNLREFLRQQREDGASFDGIARALLIDHQVSVSSEVVRKWCIAEGIHDPQPTQAA